MVAPNWATRRPSPSRSKRATIDACTAADRNDLDNSSDGEIVPAAVQASIVARFDRLGEGRLVAQFGATIGRDFAYPLVRAVTGMSDEELQGHLDRLCE